MKTSQPIQPQPSPQLSSQPQPQRQTFTRADLIAIGQADKPYAFIPLAVQVLSGVAEDPGIRFLLAINLSKLGLRTLAQQTLARFPKKIQQDPDVCSLIEALSGLPDDRLRAETRITTARANLEALGSRGADIEKAFESWAAAQESIGCYRTTDGNIVRHVHDPVRTAQDFSWISSFSEQRGVARYFVANELANLDMFPLPMSIEGFDPPWFFAAVYEALAPNILGYRPSITLLQGDTHEFLDGLSCMDIHDALADPRVRVFVGSDASERWYEDMCQRMGEIVIGPVVPLKTIRTRIDPRPEVIIERIKQAQECEQTRLMSVIESRYGQRDRAYWQQRFADARDGDKPLRIVLPISRYSTYVKHAAEDLAAAFIACGMDIEIITESRTDAQLVPIGYLRVVEAFDPDCVVMINFFRDDTPLRGIASLPWVCWFQDALPHQFGERTFGDLDFFIGHIHKEIAAQAGFPRERAAQFPLVASTRIFHTGRVDPVLARKYTSEIAYVSHQSETPEAFHIRCIREFGDPEVEKVIETLRPLVQEACADPDSSSLAWRLERAAQHAITQVEQITPDQVDPGKRRYLYRHYALPFADRVLRHESLAWAKAICERRGWTLAIYGNGWETHPTLASCARGSIEHNEDLRACYASAAVHLHASVNTLVHQRVMECALSGGLPLCRYIFDALSESTGFARRETLLHYEPIERDSRGGLTFQTSACPPLMAIAPQWESVGRAFPQTVYITPEQVASFRRPDHEAATGLHASWLLGDLGEMTFASEAALEAAVQKAITDPAWRASRAAGIAERVKNRCSTDVLAQRMLSLVYGGFGIEEHPWKAGEIGCVSGASRAT